MSEDNQETQSDSQQHETTLARKIGLENRVKSGANWFYWIAGLSVVNSVIVLAQGEWSFIVGLGVTQVVDALSLGIVDEAPESKAVATAIAIFVNLVTVTVCATFGVLANKKKPWAFWVGMVLYGLDGLLFLTVADYLSFGFHVFALWGIYSGLRALQEIRATTGNQTLGAVSPN